MRGRQLRRWPNRVWVVPNKPKKSRSPWFLYYLTIVTKEPPKKDRNMLSGWYRLYIYYFPVFFRLPTFLSMCGLLMVTIWNSWFNNKSTIKLSITQSTITPKSTTNVGLLRVEYKMCSLVTPDAFEGKMARQRRNITIMLHPENGDHCNPGLLSVEDLGGPLPK